MSSEQGWFESDDDYRSRIAKEADEHTVEQSTGEKPSQGFFESDESYRDRVSKEANEHRINSSTGSEPSQGLFESDESYRDRIHREANERTIEDSTGEKPAQGWFESDEDYDIRVRKEANEHIIRSGSDESPKQGWFEGDHDYRSRIAHESRLARIRSVEEQRKKDSDSRTRPSSIGCSPIFALAVAIIIGVAFLINVIDDTRKDNRVRNIRATPSTQHNELSVQKEKNSKNIEELKVNLSKAIKDFYGNKVSQCLSELAILDNPNWNNFTWDRNGWVIFDTIAMQLNDIREKKFNYGIPKPIGFKEPQPFDKSSPYIDNINRLLNQLGSLNCPDSKPYFETSCLRRWIKPKYLKIYSPDKVDNICNIVEDFNYLATGKERLIGTVTLELNLRNDVELKWIITNIKDFEITPSNITTKGSSTNTFKSDKKNDFDTTQQGNWKQNRVWSPSHYDNNNSWIPGKWVDVKPNQKQGHWEVKKVWIPSSYEKRWQPSYYDRNNGWISGRWVNVETQKGYWKEERVWVTP